MVTGHPPLTRSHSAAGRRLFGLLAGGALLALALIWSITVGAADIDASTVWQALTNFNPDIPSQVIIRELRIPRALVAALVGAALAVAGALMQGLTRNPLADTKLLGIESGAALGVVSAVSLLHLTSLFQYTWFAFLGAALAALTVYGLGSLAPGGATPLSLTLAGAVLSLLLTSLTTALLILSQETLQSVRFWLAGSLVGRDATLLAQAAPYLLGGLLLALALGRQITTASLGDDVARGLGQNVALVRGVSALAIVLLAGGAVAVAGPIGFLGLIVPHAVRFFVGVDYRWILPYTALAGALVLLGADAAARLLLRPAELPVGAMTALLGGPVFVYLVRWQVRR